jgi:hypothetical protein
LYGHKRVATT